MAEPKTCFVIMPIRKPGTQEYTDFRSLYDIVIKPPLKEAGYDVVRADDVEKGGAITADVIHRLATADLVVADLTDLNANVMYELGIRHALRRLGTVMIVDTTRTKIPFDLQQYRAIEFVPNLTGYDKLRQALVHFASVLDGDITAEIERDNPVHQYLPALPGDLYSHAEGSSEGKLREQVAELQRQIRRYVDRYGTEYANSESPADVIAMTLDQARRGELPINLFYRARAAAREEDAVTFLALTHQLIENPQAFLKSNQWYTLGVDATNIGLDNIALIVFRRAIDQRPNDENLKRLYYGKLAHSEDPRQRDLARKELGALLGIHLSNGSVTVSGSIKKEQLRGAALMLDAYHRDGMHEPAVAITQALLDHFPSSTISLRNHARALMHIGREEEAMQVYAQAIVAPDVDDTTALWLGNEYYRTREYDKACILYLRACELDPNDPDLFLEAADLLADLLAKQGVHTKGAHLPDELVSEEVIAHLLVASFSCKTINAEVLNKTQDIVERAGLSEEIVAQLAAIRKGDGTGAGTLTFMNRAERVKLVQTLLGTFDPDDLATSERPQSVERPASPSQPPSIDSERR
jgi:tetratricopeptide (TPR) repeat protein